MGTSFTLTAPKKGLLALGCGVVLATAAMGVLAVQDAHAATVALTAQSQAKGSSAFVKSTKTVKSLAAIKIKVKGAKASELSYRVNGKGSYVKAGKAAGKKSADARIIQVKLSGSLAKSYDVYYRAKVKGYGWTDWAQNGAKTGDAYKLNITQYNVKLVKKSASAPGATYAPFISKVTGNSTVDSKIAKTVSNGKIASLLDAFKWTVQNISYQNTGREGSLKTVSQNRLLTEVKAAFGKNAAGDCYTYSCGMYALATYLGYSAKVVPGTMTYTSTSGEKDAPMCWTEVVDDGATWIYDGATQRSQDKNFEKTDRYHFYAPKGQTTFTYTAAA